MWWSLNRNIHQFTARLLNHNKYFAKIKNFNAIIRHWVTKRNQVISKSILCLESGKEVKKWLRFHWLTWKRIIVHFSFNNFVNDNPHFQSFFTFHTILTSGRLSSDSYYTEFIIKVLHRKTFKIDTISGSSEI